MNFALDSWVEIGKKASYCRCVGDSVKLDVAQFFGDKNEAVEVDEEEEDEAEEQDETAKITPARRKRKSTEGDEARTHAKRRKPSPESKPVRKARRRSLTKGEESAEEPKSEPKKTPIRIRIQLPSPKVIDLHIY